MAVGSNIFGESGKIKLGYYTEEGEEIIKAVLKKGELFGEKALLGESKRCEFAQVLEKGTSVCPIDVDTLQDLMRNNQNLALSIYKFINYRFWTDVTVQWQTRASNRKR